MYGIPPSVDRKYVGLRATLTREGWPGQTTLAAPIAATDTTLFLPVGAGNAHFPAEPPARIGLMSGTAVEGMRLVARIGDSLVVVRGRVPLAFPTGATLTWLDIVKIEFQVTQDGVTWTRAGDASFPGGVAINPDTGEPEPISGVGFSSSLGGVRLAQPGDTRVVIVNGLSFRTALTLEMLETTDP